MKIVKTQTIWQFFVQNNEKCEIRPTFIAVLFGFLNKNVNESSVLLLDI